MANCVLVVAAHADDEVLGCGATIMRHVAEGDIVYAVFMADGVSSRIGSNNKDLATRNEQAENARAILGIKKNFYMGFPDNRMDTIPLIEIVQQLEKIIDRLQPNIVYTHHHGDLNVDHRITHQAVLTACRPIPDSSLQAIYTFEVASSTDWANQNNSSFIPCHFINIEKYLERKIAALDAYSLEMRPVPHSRSIEHIVYLSHHRGHTVGLVAAEAFMIVRTIRN